MNSIQLLIGIFENQSDAESALTSLQTLKKEKQSGIDGAIMITKDVDGQKLHYKDTGMTPGKGALGGVVLGAAVGILTGGAGLILGAAGAALGSWAGKKKQDQRFDTSQINQVAASLKPGGAAIMTVLESEAVSTVSDVLKKHEAEVLSTTISTDVAQALRDQNQ